VRIKVSTYFDITETGINRVYKSQNLPTKINGKTIKTEEEWNLKRKQQNNFETVMQVLSMRGTPVDISKPTNKDGVWSFTFEVDSALVYGDDLALLIEELEGTPMITGLTEQKDQDSFLNSDNIWFDVDV
jgi:hypothetical protein